MSLETTYRRLMLAYPSAYRRERGDEVIGALLDAAAPDQRRPSAREATALVIGGVRQRIGLNRRRGYVATWRHSARRR